MTGSRWVTLRDEVSGADERHLRATVTDTGALRIDGQDFGPSTAPVSPDGEYEWVTVVSRDHLPTLIGLLGGSPGEDVLDLLERAWTGPRSYGFERVLRESGIPFDRHVF